MEFTVKYGIWNVAKTEIDKVKNLQAAGYSPLTARVLCSRGYDTQEKADAFLSASGPLPDPMLMQDMDKAVRRVQQALQRREHIAVFGDYDVDGITSTCLLTEFLRSQGGCVTYYIPSRIEEGYGLNEHAISSLKDKGVSLIVTVDCGITANREADFCREIGVDLIITDHHECKDDLPDALAVVDPHRKDDPYPHRNLAGVGVAFKLAAAILGSQNAILDRFSDLLCLGTVADVMPLVGENRTFVVLGLQALSHAPRPGISALMEACGCEGRDVTSSVIGYTLAPRINAAGRMGQVELATELMLTNNPDRAMELARMLCQLNRQRQEIEAEIYQEAVSMLAGDVGRRHDDGEGLLIRVTVRHKRARFLPALVGLPLNRLWIIGFFHFKGVFRHSVFSSLCGSENNDKSNHGNDQRAELDDQADLLLLFFILPHEQTGKVFGKKAAKHQHSQQNKAQYFF